MLLTIDVGNTHTVLGLFDGEEIVEHWRISTDARRTADELAVLLQGLMGMHPLLGEELGDGIEGIAICSTVPSVLHELREVTRRYYGDVPAVLVEPGVKTGVPVLMDNPKEVGADRIINALAAVELYGGPCVVVDFGTATTFDAVSARGEYVGGVIAPGIEISVDALGVKRRPAAQDRAGPAAQRHRQEHRRGHAVRHPLRLRRPGRRRRRADGAPSWPTTRTRSPSSPPAAWRRWCSASPRSSTSTSPGSPSSACGWSTSATSPGVAAPAAPAGTTRRRGARAPRRRAVVKRILSI